ncbi:hypothetical protein HWI79_249 [Cryptosporidium felis]|nr:hypothetical protein HWI79_249 [Cryptosporidium felis]
MVGEPEIRSSSSLSSKMAISLAGISSWKPDKKKLSCFSMSFTLHEFAPSEFVDCGGEVQLKAQVFNGML